jgi:hypothetical protein
VPDDELNLGLAIAALGLDRPFGGLPSDDLRAWFVDEAGVLARIAASISLTRRGGRLVRRERGDGGPAMLCLAYGELVRSRSGRLGMRSLTVGPILTPQSAGLFGEAGPPLHRWEPAAEIPVTGALLRLISVEDLVSRALERLRTHEHWREVGRRLGELAPPTERDMQRLMKLRKSTAPSRRPTEDEIAAIAGRYVMLVTAGVRHPLPQLASEFGLTRDQARDRVHRARVLEYLLPAAPGRVSAEPGPKLLRPLPANPCGVTFKSGGEQFTCSRELGHSGHHIQHGRLRFQADTVDPNPPKRRRRPKEGKEDG